MVYPSFPKNVSKQVRICAFLSKESILETYFLYVNSAQVVEGQTFTS